MLRAAWSADAVEDLLDIASRDIRQAKRIRTAVEQFCRGQSRDVKKLHGRDDDWRIRSGDWRILFHYEGKSSIVIDSVDNRRDAYD